MTEVRRIGPEDGFLREFTEFRDRVKSLETAPAGNIVIRETLTTEDPETGVQTTIGRLPDGSYGFQPFIGDIIPPPVATTPIVSATSGAFVVAWDGLFVAGAEQPKDFQHVNVIGHKMIGATTALSLTVGVIRLSSESVLVTTDVAAAGESWEFSLEAEDYNGNKAVRSARSLPQTMIAVLSTVDAAWTDMEADVASATDAASSAQSSAAAAQAKADEVAMNLSSTSAEVTAAQQRADEAFNNATSAATAAGNAQTSADSKNKNWYQTTAPAGTGHKAGDTWFDTDDGNRVYIWTGAAWTDHRDTGITAAQTAANTALTAANGKNKNYYGPSMPTGGTYTLGDTWFDTDDGNKIYVHNGTTFVNAQDTSIATAQSTAASKTKTFVSATAPTATTQGDIWIDTANGNVIKTWEGSAWVTRADAAIAAADSKAGTALTAANGKNKIYYQTQMPTGGTYTAGDTWFDTNDGNKIYVHNGTTFVASQLGTSAIANLAITDALIGNLDAAKITSGFLGAGRIQANTISTDKLLIGSTDNLISEPTFNGGGVSWANTGAYSIDPTGARNGGPAWKIANAAVQQGTYNKPDKLPTEEGQAYRFIAYVKSDVDIPVGMVALYVTTRTAAGASSVVVAGSSGSASQDIVGTIPANTWTKIEGIRIVPAGHVNISFGIYSQAGFATGNVWVDFASATRMATGELIVDGAIQAGSAIIGTGAIGTAQIADLAVDTAKIKDTAITNAKIADATIQSAKIGSVDAGTITVGTLSAARIAAGSIGADKLVIGVGNNLAYNGSAEIAGSNKGYTAFTRTTTDVPPGFGAAWQTPPTTATINFLTDPAVPVKPQTRYKLNMWVKADKAGSVMYLEPMTGSVAAGNRTNPIYAFSNAAVPTVWTKWSVEFDTGLSVTNTLYFRLFANHTNGTVFDSVFSFTGFTLTEMNAGELIVDGAITTDHMTAGTIDASVLTAGSITAPKIAAKAITTDKLVITSSDNLVVGGDMALSAASWGKNATITAQPTAGRGSMPALRFGGITGAQASTNLSNRVTVEPDNKFRCSIFVKSTAALAIDRVRLMIRCFTSATTSSDVIGVYNTAPLVANTWTQVKGISASLPANTLFVEFYLYVTNPDTATNTDIDYVSATRAFDGNLVVDGAIDGQTITGATVRTAASGARIELNSTGLYGWDAGNVNYLKADSTGLTVTGTLGATGTGWTDGASPTSFPVSLTVGAAAGNAGAVTEQLPPPKGNRPIPGMVFSPVGVSMYIAPGMTATNGERLKLSSGIKDSDVSANHYLPASLTLDRYNSVLDAGHGTLDVKGPTKINGTDMRSKHVEFTNGFFQVAGGNQSWDIGPLTVDTAKSVAGHANIAVPGPFAGSVKMLESGYYTVAVMSIPLAGPGQCMIRMYLGSNTSNYVAQYASTGYYWEMYVTTGVIYIAANDYIRVQVNQANTTNNGSRVWVHKMPF